MTARSEAVTQAESEAAFWEYGISRVVPIQEGWAKTDPVASAFLVLSREAGVTSDLRLRFIERAERRRIDAQSMMPHPDYGGTISTYTAPLSLALFPARQWRREVSSASADLRRDAVAATGLPERRLGELSRRVRAMFEYAAQLRFEDGIENQFSKGLVALVRKEGAAALEAIEVFIMDTRTSAEVAGEALRWLGLIEDPPSHRDRLSLLARSLHAASAKVRDGAIVGLALLDDPAALPALRAALEQETSTSLREDIIQVIEQLESS